MLTDPQFNHFILFHTLQSGVWEPVVTHHTSWLESTGVCVCVCVCVVCDKTELVGVLFKKLHQNRRHRATQGCMKLPLP